MNNKLLIVLAIGLALSSQVVVADKKQEASIFKCINNQGSVYYNDKPCPVKDKETRIHAVKDPVNGSLVRTPLAVPVFANKKPKRVTGKGTKDAKNSRVGKPNNKQNVVIDELEGADAMLKAERQRAERSRMFAGASDADERRAAQNDRKSNPPEGYIKPLGSSGIKVIKLTEKMAIDRMRESVDK